LLENTFGYVDHNYLTNRNLKMHVFADPVTYVDQWR